MTPASPSATHVTQDNIWNYRQNHPELIVRDATAAFGLNEGQQEQLRAILMARGVNKWLAVRRSIISLKDLWRERITYLNDSITFYKHADVQEVGSERFRHNKIIELRAMLKEMTWARGAIRELCHSERWVPWSRRTGEYSFAIPKTRRCRAPMMPCGHTTMELATGDDERLGSVYCRACAEGRKS